MILCIMWHCSGGLSDNTLENLVIFTKTYDNLSSVYFVHDFQATSLAVFKLQFVSISVHHAQASDFITSPENKGCGRSGWLPR